MNAPDMAFSLLTRRALFFDGAGAPARPTLGSVDDILNGTANDPLKAFLRGNNGSVVPSLSTPGRAEWTSVSWDRPRSWTGPGASSSRRVAAAHSWPC